jgi:tagatose-6-phosphate ketose/aldose isomerase
MTTLLGIDEATLKARNGYWTAREIAQQPETLAATAALIASEGAALEAFLAPLLTRHEMRVILTGAGTSAFIGDSLALWLARRLTCRVESLATTDITCAPHLRLDPHCPTLLVSFGRSGDSPESAAAIDAAEALIAECHHLAITCNADGALVGRMASVRSGRTLCLPPETLDRGFAMTSSYTAMSFAARALLGGGAEALGACGAVCAAVASSINTMQGKLRRLATGNFDRVVYLGSHVFTGAAHEAALKLLELTDGRVAAIHETPLGFRHGPKTFVTDHTLVIMMLSSDPRIRAYDLDLAREIAKDGRAQELVLLDGSDCEVPGTTKLVVPGGLTSDIDLLIPYVVAAQMIGLYASLDHGLTPDRPNVSGTVNRVVEGVTIHALA